ncbi:zinc ribbon domain-containing protein [Streptococcus pluranimalium]|uniref:zinc ribbon domain-containing protein n=1 Tax=Streptococcus pluranimalium TaxID=82348 RepID=UPI004046EF0E
MEKFCQSCAMPLNLHGEDVRGSETNGLVSESYCYYCYQNGQWTEPNITYKAMLTKGKKAISQGQGNALFKSLMKLSYPMMLKRAKRWQ